MAPRRASRSCRRARTLPAGGAATFVSAFVSLALASGPRVYGIALSRTEPLPGVDRPWTGVGRRARTRQLTPSSCPPRTDVRNLRTGEKR